MNASTDFLDRNSSTGDGEEHPSVYMPGIGSKIVGKILTTPKSVETQYGARLVFDVEVLDGSNCQKGARGSDGAAAVGETLTLWIKPGNQAAAIRDAIGAAKETGLSEGATLAIAITEQKDTGKGNPLNIHAAQYVPGTPAVAAGMPLI